MASPINAVGGPSGRRRQSRSKVRPPGPEAVIRLLSDAYGSPEWKPRMEPLDELIFTVLTQHTSDLNAERAFSRMRRVYPAWSDVVSAPAADLAGELRQGGLANQKSVRIQEILREVLRRRGHFDVSFLGRLTLDEAREWLLSLPGVGPKTAAVVLAFSFGMPALPVDTHVHRVTQRLGLIGAKTSADKAHGELEMLVPPGLRFAFHVLLISHGRKVCSARSPKCDSCVLAEVCPSAGRVLSAVRARNAS